MRLASVASTRLLGQHIEAVLLVGGIVDGKQLDAVTQPRRMVACSARGVVMLIRRRGP